MKTTRRQMLKASMGAAQLALLGRFARSTPSLAQASSDGPSRLLTLYVPGGYHPTALFCPLTPEQVSTFLPGPEQYLGEKVFFGPEDLTPLAAAGTGGYDPVQIVRSWDPASPGDRGQGYAYNPLGYAWQHHGLHEQLAVVHGIDQQTAAHDSGYIAAMCGVAGPLYRAPALPCIAAQALSARYPNRPLPVVALDGRRVPVAQGLPTRFAPSIVPSIDTLGPRLSASAETNPWWAGLDARTMADEPRFDGTPGGSLSATLLERAVLRGYRAQRGRSTAGTDAFLQRIHDGFKDVSRVMAQDLVTTLQNTPGIEHYTAPLEYGGVRPYGNWGPYGFKFGLANGGTASGETAYEPPFDMALRLMKADVASAIHLYMPKHHFDSHSSTGHKANHLWLRGTMDVIARFLGEMKATPAPNRPGKTLLEDTLVLIFSEFSRTWPLQGDDHWPITSVMFAGGGVGENRQLGGFDMAQFSSGPMGQPWAVTEETGHHATRPLKAADVVTTAMRLLGAAFDDFFIPGGYGEIAGVRA